MPDMQVSEWPFRITTFGSSAISADRFLIERYVALVQLCTTWAARRARPRGVQMSGGQMEEMRQTRVIQIQVWVKNSRGSC